ncbi:MAG: sulfite exporter TauE/SafE family protein [Akkermansiaceae bacterium]
MKLLITGLCIGAVAGLLGALCGVGGGLVMVPAFVMALGMEQKSAVATSLAVIVVTALSGTLSNITSASKLIDWKLVLVTGIGAGLAAWFGADLMRSLKNPALTKIFGVTVILFGVLMLIKKG